MEARKRNFIVIDDNKLDCFIAQKIILNTGVSDKISSFLDAGAAFDFVKTDAIASGAEKIIIIVDIQMPLMNGFQFVEAFETLPKEVQDGYVIFMLSSSINENDLNRVRNYKSVIEVVNKPLSLKKLAALLSKI